MSCSRITPTFYLSLCLTKYRATLFEHMLRVLYVLTYIVRHYSGICYGFFMSYHISCDTIRAYVTGSLCLTIYRATLFEHMLRVLYVLPYIVRHCSSICYVFVNAPGGRIQQCSDVIIIPNNVTYTDVLIR